MGYFCMPMPEYTWRQNINGAIWNLEHIHEVDMIYLLNFARACIDAAEKQMIAEIELKKDENDV